MIPFVAQDVFRMRKCEYECFSRILTNFALYQFICLFYGEPSESGYKFHSSDPYR